MAEARKAFDGQGQLELVFSLSNEFVKDEQTLHACDRIGQSTRVGLRM
jgi:hypothetical protein